MSWQDSLKHWIGLDKQELTYVIATVRTPWSRDNIAQLTPYWVASEFVSMVEKPVVKAELLKDLKWTEQKLAKALEIADLRFFKHFPLVGLLVEKKSVVLPAKTGHVI